MIESEYYHLTYDLTLAVANAIAAVASRRLTFCHVSGEGTDSTDRGCSAWARTKGRTENALLRLPFKAAYMFRPGYIQPLKGIRSSTRRVQRSLQRLRAVLSCLTPTYWRRGRDDHCEPRPRHDSGRRLRLLQIDLVFRRHQSFLSAAENS